MVNEECGIWIAILVRITTDKYLGPNNPKATKIVWIPKEYWYDQRLDFAEKCVLTEIRRLSGMTKEEQFKEFAKVR